MRKGKKKREEKGGGDSKRVCELMMVVMSRECRENIPKVNDVGFIWVKMFNNFGAISANKLATCQFRSVHISA